MRNLLINNHLGKGLILLDFFSIYFQHWLYDWATA